MERIRFNYPGQSEQSFDPKQWEQMKVDSLNKSTGNLTDYDCPKCRNKGFIAALRDDHSIFTKECDCMQIRRCIHEMERSGLKKVISELTFDKFVATEPWQKALKDGVQKYAEDLEGWLLLCGQPGSGKTHLCTAVCRNRLLMGDAVKYMPWRDEIAQLKAMSLDSENRAIQMDELKRAAILYVDDLFKTGTASDGSANPSAADVSIAFELINYRYNNRLTTIVSTEKSPEGLLQIDEATGSRIIEMAQGHTFNISMDTGKNYRLRGVVAL